ncbi:hypothetical protein M440DRAFT_1345066, partial [Trichoderma longibrachiatum ATCC 18648]
FLLTNLLIEIITKLMHKGFNSNYNNLKELLKIIKTVILRALAKGVFITI